MSDKPSHSVISYFELSENVRRSMERQGSEQTEFVAISRLRQRGLFGLFRRIRALKSQNITIAIESENSRQLAGPLILLAAVTGSRRIEVSWPDGTRETISYRAIAAWFFKIVGAQVSSRFAYWRARQRLNALPRQTLPSLSGLGSRTGNVLYLDGNLPIGPAVGGSVAHIRGVIDGLVGRGLHVDYLSGKAIPTSVANSRWLKVPPTDLLAIPPELNCYLFNRAFDACAEKFAWDNSYAFIYQRMSVHNFTGAFLRRKLGVPLILEYNGSEAWTAANWNRKLRLHDMAVSTELASLRNADLVVTVSSALAEEVAAAGVHREKIVTFPNCFDPRIFDPSRFSPEEIFGLRERLQISRDACVATFIGTFGVWHGVDFLAKAIRRLIDTDYSWVVEHKLHFLLIGDGLKMAEVQATLGQKPYADVVTLTGMVPQNSAPAYLAASDIFLSPHVPNADGSEFFGSPTKLFEYMAMERPIVASDLAQIGSVLRGTYPGYAEAPATPMAELFIPGDEKGFLAALRKVVENPEPAREMARNARAAALNTFTWSHHVSAILSRARDLGVLE
jgi:glycosyltransferase involved in cell wall biosynthesis